MRQCNRSTSHNTHHYHHDHWNRHRFNRLRSTPAIIDTAVRVTMTHEEVTPGHTTNPHPAAHHATETQVYMATAKTPNTEDPHHTEVFPGITVDPDLAHHPNMTTKLIKTSYSSYWTAWKNREKKYKQVTIDDPPSDHTI